MLKIGDKVLIKKGVFINQTGTIEHEFDYNNLKRYTVAIFKGKNIENKFIATCSEYDLETLE